MARVSNAAIAEFAESMLGSEEVLLADIGSIGGAHGRWDLLGGKLKVLMFDPRESNDEPEKDHNKIIHRSGLSSSAGAERLNILKFGNMSSFLMPNPELMGRYFKTRVRTKVVGDLSVTTTTLDSVVKNNSYRIDAIKIDTQGTELDIIEGGICCVERDVLFAEVEVSFFERYVGQPLFGDVCTKMSELGFELLDIYQMRRYHHYNSIGIMKRKMAKRLGLTGRIAYANALFVPTLDRLMERAQGFRAEEQVSMLRRLCAILAVYGKFDLVAALFDRYTGFFTEKERAQLAELSAGE